MEKKFSSRELFSNQTKINIRGTTIVDLIHKLPFKGKINNALINGLINYEFPNVFTGDKTIIQTKTINGGLNKRLNEFYKFQEFNDAYKVSMIYY